MTTRTALSRIALRAAIELRTKLSISETAPICIYDVAEKLGVEVRFLEGDSFEGMYYKDKEIILVPTMRPYGRQAFSCAHELGHWYFKHGTQVDQLLGNSDCALKSDEEYLADTFAGYMLMPPWSVKQLFLSRDLHTDTCSPLEAYKISCQLGVGYETLIDHLYYSLRKMPPEARERLMEASPKGIREDLLGKAAEGVRHLTVVDGKWDAVVPVDLQVGDVAIIERAQVIAGGSVGAIGNSSLGQIIQAVKPGLSTVASKSGEWSVFVRVARKNFVGRCIYRHLGDPDVD